MDLNIITLNIPFPPDYGGMIDSFYRIKWLKTLGVRIHLHCFESGRNRSDELESLCETVNLYPRQTKLVNQLSKIPYIVKSRFSNQLLENLKLNSFPIFFDGLHTTYFLNHHDLFTISGHDFNFFSASYKKVFLLRPFHPFEEVISNTGKGEYILYHGDLSVSENSLVACSLIKNVFSKLEFSCIIAGKNPPKTLLSEASGLKQLRVIADPGQKEMEELIKNAHINVMPALSANGFKLKHLYSLFAGRHCIINSISAQNFEDRSLFHIADSDEEMIRMINKLMPVDFQYDIVIDRKKSIEKTFSNIRNAKILAEIIFG